MFRLLLPIGGALCAVILGIGLLYALYSERLTHGSVLTMPKIPLLDTLQTGLISSNLLVLKGGPLQDETARHIVLLGMLLTSSAFLWSFVLNILRAVVVFLANLLNLRVRRSYFLPWLMWSVLVWALAFIFFLPAASYLDLHYGSSIHSLLRFDMPGASQRDGLLVTFTGDKAEIAFSIPVIVLAFVLATTLSSLIVYSTRAAIYSIDNY